jgi:hypothetical protein
MALDTREIPQSDWQAYFDDLSRRLQAPPVTVEVDGAEIGAQIEAEHTTLAGISYDRRDDVLVVGVGSHGGEQLEHLVSNPRQIYVAEGDGEMTIDVQDGEGIKTLIRVQPA